MQRWAIKPIRPYSAWVSVPMGWNKRRQHLYILVIKIVIATVPTDSSESDLWLKFELLRIQKINNSWANEYVDRLPIRHAFITCCVISLNWRKVNVCAYIYIYLFFNQNPKSSSHSRICLCETLCLPTDTVSTDFSHWRNWCMPEL